MCKCVNTSHAVSDRSLRVFTLLVYITLADLERGGVLNHQIRLLGLKYNKLLYGKLTALLQTHSWNFRVLFEAGKDRKGQKGGEKMTGWIKG